MYYVTAPSCFALSAGLRVYVYVCVVGAPVCACTCMRSGREQLMASSSSHSGDPVAKYVGFKISRVRWKPQPSGAIECSEYFATGSWDDEVGFI